MTTLIENVIAAARTAKGRPSTADKAGWAGYREIVAALADGKPLTDTQSAELADCLATFKLTDSTLANDVREWQRRPGVVASAKAAAERCGLVEAEAGRIEAEREAFYREHGDTVRRAAELDFAHQQSQAAVPKARHHARQTQLALDAHSRDFARLFAQLEGDDE